jgi:hypothetical protein
MVPAVMAAGSAGGTTIVIMSSVLNRMVPKEAWNKTNSIKDEVLRALQVYIAVFWIVTVSSLLEVINISKELDVCTVPAEYRCRKLFQNVSNHPQDHTTHKTKM